MNDAVLFYFYIYSWIHSTYYSERQYADLILNFEQLPNITRAFGGGTSWLDYETTSPRGAEAISPRSIAKAKDRAASTKPMNPINPNICLDSMELHHYGPSLVYQNPVLSENQQQTTLDRFSGVNDAVNSRNSSHVLGQPHLTTGNTFASHNSNCDYPDEFSPNIAGGGITNISSSSPAWYQSVSREGLLNGEELSPYDLSPRQGTTHWIPSFTQNQCTTDQPINNVGLYPTLEGMNEDPALEIAQRVLHYPMSNDGRSQHYPGDIRSQDSGLLDRNIGQEVYQQDPRQDHQPHEPVNNHTNLPVATSWKEVESQIMANNKCITIPGGGTLQALHPMQPSQRCGSRASVYSNNSSISDRGSPSMATLSNLEPSNPSIPTHVNTSGGLSGCGSQRSMTSTEPLQRISSPDRGGEQNYMDSLSASSRSIGNNAARCRLLNPLLSHSMGELEIVSSVSSESTPVSAEQSIASNLSESRVSNIGDVGNSSTAMNRKLSTD